MTVAKVGGSLFDLADLRSRLTAWLARVPGEDVVLVPGGGAAADVVRGLELVHHLSEETCHWLALRMLTVNAHFLSALLGVPVRPSPTEPGQSDPAPGRAAGSFRPRSVVVLDAWGFCQSDEGTGGALAHSWRVTSDSVAARVAWVAGARLALLKSTDRPPGWTWEQTAAAGLVDESFPSVVAAGNVSVEWVNLRGG